jgi:splicing factor 3A subunit 1
MAEADRVILPPPIVREIIDRTAGFIAKNGRSYEERIARSAPGTIKFAFLSETHPYHDYYEQTIVKLKAEGVTETNNPDANTNNATVSNKNDANTSTMNAKDTPKKDNPNTITNNENNAEHTATNSSIVESFEVLPFAVRTTQPVLKEEPISMDVYLLDRPDWVDNRIDDIIKLVARYVAAGGESFISGLAVRESRNPDFAFLKTGHGLHSYYQRVLSSYRATLQPTEKVIQRLKVLANDSTGHQSLKECLYRLRWSEKKQAEREQDKDATETQHAMANIDWHDFVIAATIDFEEEEEFGVSKTSSGEETTSSSSSSNGSSASMTGGENGDDKDSAKNITNNGSVEEEEEEEGDNGMDISDDDEESNGGTSSSSNNNNNDDIEIVENYVPDVSGRTKNTTKVLDPHTGFALSADEVGEHLRIELLDPAWKEQRDRFIAKQKKTNQISDGDNIASNLKRFANNRPDLFQDGGKGEEGEGDGSGSSSSNSSNSSAPVVWDGRTGSIAQVREAANQAQEEMLAQQQQLRELGQHPDQQMPKEGGIGPAMPALPSNSIFSDAPITINRTSLSLPVGLPPPVIAPAIVGDGSVEPDSKRPRLLGPPPSLLGPPPTLNGVPPLVPQAVEEEESAVLIPGDEWLELCNGQLDLLVTVKVPNDATNASNWATLGQTLSIATDVTCSVLSLKENICQKLGGKIPLNKFQLKHSLRGFIKDKLKFTDLNFRHDVSLDMILKTRKRRR